ncbi:MAG TPA: carboxypeptidase regulatory-like domain-containing protein, partial [Longimicrobium sp.]|nr:carboxypeptidase regulatory-like domain-containing protein [Longimicrobium sp.]
GSRPMATMIRWTRALLAALLLAAVVSGRDARAQAGVVRGTVWDSTRAAPLAGARVYLAGTASSVQSGADGAFVLTAPGEGRYLLAFTHPELGLMAAVVQPHTVTLRAGDTVEVALAVPGWRTLTRALCPDSTLRHEAGVVAGVVTGPGAASATVTASWYAKGYSTRAASFTREELTTRADADGLYVLCGVSTQSELTVRAESSTAHGHTETRIRNGRPARVDVEMHDGSG